MFSILGSRPRWRKTCGPGKVRVVDFAFSQQSAGRLGQRLFNLLREHALDLPDDDPELLSELATVRIRESSPGVYRMDSDRSGHDDRAVSLALAANQLMESVPHRSTKLRYYPPAPRELRPLAAPVGWPDRWPSWGSS